MKKNIKFESLEFIQSKVIKKKLNLKHLILIDYLNQFFLSGKAIEKVHRNNIYYLITLNKILEDLPILSIKKRRLQELLSELETAKILYRIYKNSTTTFIRLNLNYITI